MINNHLTKEVEMKKKQGIIERMFHSLIRHLFKLGLFIIGVLFLFTLLLGSEYSFSLRRASIVAKRQKTTFQKYIGGVKVLKYIAKVF